MNWYIAILSMAVACFICKPLFVYLLKAVSNNADEFDEGFKKEFPNDSAYKPSIGGRQRMKHFPGEATEDAGIAMFVVLILPLIPASFIAVGLYFIFNWLFSLV